MNSQMTRKADAWNRWVELQNYINDHDCKYDRDNGCSACEWLENKIEDLVETIKESDLMETDDKKELLFRIDRKLSKDFPFI